jgi:hypothetical protein
MYREGSYKWAFAIFFAILVAIGLCYPHQCLFLLKFLWDLVVINLEPVIKAVHEKLGH